MRTQQRQLLEPFPPTLIKRLPGRGGQADYVSWTDKMQRLIEVVGSFDWIVVSVTHSGDEAEPVAVHGRLKVELDGQVQVRDGIGNGQDAKKAETDAFSRACAKYGIGLHLWCQGGDKDGGYWILDVLE